MLIHLQNRSNGTSVLPSRQDSKPVTSPAAPAHEAVNPNPPPPIVNQVPVNNISTNSTPRASSTVSVANPPQPIAITPFQPAAITPPQPVAITNVHPSSGTPVAAPGTALAPPATITLASSPPLGMNSANLPTNASPTGLASTRSTYQSNTPDNLSGSITSSDQHTPTGVIVAIGLSGIVITLMFMILIRFLVKCLSKNTLKGRNADDSLIVIPPTAFLDHPKNQEIGGVGASPSPMINRSTSTSSIRSSMSFKKPQEQSLINHSNHSHYDLNGYFTHDPGFYQQPAMEFLHPMGAPFTQPKSWDGSRPTLGHNRSYY